MELGTEQFADPESGTQWQDAEGYGPDRQTPLPPPIDDTVRAPLDYAYTAIDIMAALPRSEAVDVDALPADLQRKASAHGDDVDNIVESEQLTTRHRRGIAWAEIARAGRSLSRSPSTAPRPPRASPLSCWWGTGGGTPGHPSSRSSPPQSRSAISLSRSARQHCLCGRATVRCDGSALGVHRR